MVNRYAHECCASIDKKQSILASLLKTQKDQFTIQIAKVNKQSGTQDCGVFAAAYCTTVAFGKDPCALVYDQKRLRHHLLKCLEDGKMTNFPPSEKEEQHQYASL